MERTPTEIDKIKLTKTVFANLSSVLTITISGLVEILNSELDEKRHSRCIALLKANNLTARDSHVFTYTRNRTGHQNKALRS